MTRGHSLSLLWCQSHQCREAAMTAKMNRAAKVEGNVPIDVEIGEQALPALSR
jgi:hypothetical protein